MYWRGEQWKTTAIRCILVALGCTVPARVYEKYQLDYTEKICKRKTVSVLCHKLYLYTTKDFWLTFIFTTNYIPHAKCSEPNKKSYPIDF